MFLLVCWVGLQKEITFLPSKDLLGRIEGHGEASDKEVGECKTDEEVVVDAPQLPVEEHAGDHQQVGEDGHQDDGEEDHSFADVGNTDLEVVPVVRLVGQVDGGWVHHRGHKVRPRSRTPHHHTSHLSQPERGVVLLRLPKTVRNTFLKKVLAPARKIGRGSLSWKKAGSAQLKEFASTG